MEIVITVLVAVVVYLFISNRKLSRRVDALALIASDLVRDIGHRAPPAAEKISTPDKAPEPKTPSVASEPAQAGPWAPAAIKSADPIKTSPTPPPARPKPPVKSKSYVFRKDLLTSALLWAQTNWFYLVAAASLGLAGVFLVQYGVETGLLTPRMRVASALVLGVALIVFGEFLRRKGGDRLDELFAYLPSTFAAGGLISLFAGILSARMLYGLIEAGPALVALATIGAGAVLIGWFYGPLLAAIGILGAIAAPFLVGGDPGVVAFLYYYFAVIVVVALLVDTFKRWAWVSSFGLLLGFAAAAYLYAEAGEALHFMAFGLIALIAAILIPERSIAPSHQGKMLVEELVPDRFRLNLETGTSDEDQSSFPTRVAAGVFLAVTGAALWVHQIEADAFWLVATCLLILFAMAAIWMRSARALSDMTLLPIIAFPVLLVTEALKDGSVFANWMTAAHRLAEEPAPWTLLIILGAALAVSLVAAWRAYRGAVYGPVWAFGAAIFAPLVAVLLELFWTPAAIIGADIWAYHAIAIAAVMVVLAERFARLSTTDRWPPALFTLAALTMISLALILMLSDAALTLALAVMALAAVVLDRRFSLPPLGIFAQLGAAVSAWRLVIDPGIDWALGAPFWEFAGTYAGVLILLWASRFLLAGPARRRTFTVIDAAFWTLSAVFASSLIYRVIDNYWPKHDDSHATTSLMALVWLISMANQFYRLKTPETWRWVRIVLAILYGLVGAISLFVATAFLNPLLSSWEPAFGPYIVDSLFVAYALPALFFLAFAVWFTHLKIWLRYGAGALAVFYAGLYVGLEIRRVWRGNDLSVPGTTDPELYSYTVAMLLASTGLLFYAFFRRSTWLRKLALAGIGLTVAKVFLIDVSGLTGLTRVFSFLFLGLALAGLAWLDRWFGAKQTAGDAAD